MTIGHCCHAGKTCRAPSRALLPSYASYLGTPITDPNPGPGGIYSRLEESGHVLERFTEEVSARMPTPDEAQVLALPPGVPIFRLVRTAFDREGRAVEVCDTIMAGDAYLLAYDLPAH